MMTSLECIPLAVWGMAIADVEDSLCTRPAAANGNIREGRSDERSGLRKAEENSLTVRDSKIEAKGSVCYKGEAGGRLYNLLHPKVSTDYKYEFSIFFEDYFAHSICDSMSLGQGSTPQRG